MVFVIAGCMTMGPQGKALRTWRSKKSTVTERLDATKSLLTEGQSITSVTNLLGPGKTLIQSKMITTKEGEKEALYGLPYSFPDGQIVLNFRFKNLVRADWKYYDADVFKRKQ